MTDDDASDANRETQGMVRHHSDPLDGQTLRVPVITESYCVTCRLFHDGFTACAVARAAVEALLIEVGEQLADDDLADVDRPALLAALRLRGISLEPTGDWWTAVDTLDTGGVPAHVEDEDTAPLAGNGR